MAERKPYTTKTRQIILEYLKRQQAVTVSVADIEKYLKDEGIKVNTTTVYRCLDKLCAEHIVIKYPDLNSDKAVFQFAGEEKKCTEHLHLKCIKCGKVKRASVSGSWIPSAVQWRYASWNLPGL